MKNFLFPALGALALVGCTSMGGGVPKLNSTKSIEINAPADKVWAIVKDYDQLPSWHPAFGKDEIIKGENNKVGAVRRLTVKDGPTFDEELLTHNEGGMTYTYKIIDPSPLPLDNYVSTVTVKPKGDGSVMMWTGDYYRKNKADNPPKGEEDAAVKGFIDGAYDAGMQTVKKMAEGG